MDDILKNISFDVRQLISINEKIQSAVLRGTILNEDETAIVCQCAKQLLDLTQTNGRRRDKAETVAWSSANGNL